MIDREFTTNIQVIQQQNALLAGVINKLDSLLSLLMNGGPEGRVEDTISAPIVSIGQGFKPSLDYNFLSIILANSQGAVSAEQFRKVLSVASATEVSFNYPSKPGFNLIFTSPFSIKTSLHDEKLTATYIVTKEKVVSRGPYPLSADLDFDVRMFQFSDGFSPEYIQLKFTNEATTNAVVTVDAQGFWVEKGMFNDKILPILRREFDRLIDYGDAVRGR